MLKGAAEARWRDVQRLCSSLVQFDFDRQDVSVCQLCLFLFIWILDIWSKTMQARRDFSLSGMNPMTHSRNCNCQQEKTFAPCTAVQVKHVMLTELLVTAESVAIKGIFACLCVMP